MAVEHDPRLSSAVGTVLQPMLKKSYVAPRPASRVGMSTDAAKYLRRNRGSSSLWLVKRCASIDLDDDDDDDGSLTVRNGLSARAPRLTGNEASEIFRRNQGSVGVVLDEKNQVGYSSARPQPRLPSSDAEANARRKAELFTQPDVACPPSKPERRVLSTEAKANATKSAGTMNTVLKTVDQPRTSEVNPLCSKSNLSLCLDGTSACVENNDTPRPQQRVKPEAQEIARKSAGNTCAAAIAGRLPGYPVCDVRASGAGRDNYEASRNGSVGSLFSTYGQQSASAGSSQLPEKIPEGPGKEIAKHGKNGTVCFLLNNYGNLPRSPRPGSRLRCEGKRFVCRNKGTNIAKCLDQTAKSQKRKSSAANRRKKA